ncbi:hypothetical protein FRAHR75_680053 [Frankia sp. Hr75.2]|nr:hypothetical protein FRAHR75_680053 [Frankia sp. Hr75.2]
MGSTSARGRQPGAGWCGGGARFGRGEGSTGPFCPRSNGRRRALVGMGGTVDNGPEMDKLAFLNVAWGRASSLHGLNLSTGTYPSLELALSGLNITDR